MMDHGVWMGGWVDGWMGGCVAEIPFLENGFAFFLLVHDGSIHPSKRAALFLRTDFDTLKWKRPERRISSQLLLNHLVDCSHLIQASRLPKGGKSESVNLILSAIVKVTFALGIG